MKTKYNVVVTTAILALSLLVLPASAETIVAFAPQPFYEVQTVRQIEGEKIVRLTGKDLYISYIQKAHDLYFPNLDVAVVQAVMQCESNYTPTVMSYAGAVGLMQVLPKYHAWRMSKYGLSDIWDPWTNVVVGMDFMSESYQKYGNYYSVLRAYGGTDKYARYVLSIADQIRYGGE